MDEEMVFFVIAKVDGHPAIVDCDMMAAHLLTSFRTRRWKALYPDSTPRIERLRADDILSLME